MSFDRFLNLGCGSRYLPGWVNVDRCPAEPSVMAIDLRRGIPFPDDSFDFVYHSHLLEHFSKSEAGPFLRECLRVLRCGGVIRVVVPDLEQIARSYLTVLEQVCLNGGKLTSEYHWRVCLLIDQCVRTKPGGEMGPMMMRAEAPKGELRPLAARLDGENTVQNPLRPSGQSPRDNGAGSLRLFWRRLCTLRRYPHYARELLLRILLGPEREALDAGRFLLQGEVHKWMYDRSSLAELLSGCGFSDVVPRTATESYMPKWASMHLDTDTDGKVYMADSLFMEALKP